MARKLIKELETKTSKLELALENEKNPLLALGLKEAMVYLAKIRQDRFKIKNLGNCFTSNKHPGNKSASSDTVTVSKHLDRRASQSSSRKTEEVKTEINRSLSRHCEN